MKKFLLILTTVLVMAGIQVVEVQEVQAASTVCTIGKKKYTSLEKAISKVKNNQTIKLKKTVKIKKNITIKKGSKKFTINLNKKPIVFLNNKKITVKTGTVTIKNKGTVYGSDIISGMIVVDTKGKLNITGGAYYGYIYNKGTMTMKGCKDYGGYGNEAIINKGNLTINGGTYDMNMGYEGIKNYKNLVINGGTFTGGITQESGNTTINNGTFYGGKYVSTGLFDLGGGTFTVNNGTFNVEGLAANASFNPIFRFVVDTTTINLNGGNYYVKYGSILRTDADIGRLNITGGTYTVGDPSKYYAINWEGFSDNYISITGGTFNGYVRLAGNLHGRISGGKYKKTSTTGTVRTNVIGNYIDVAGNVGL